MKRKITLLLTLLGACLSSVSAQTWTYDSISMGTGYANQIFYDLVTGSDFGASTFNWDIAHSNSRRSSAIRANHGRGTMVYLYPKGDINDFTSFDTTGWTSWRQVYNDVHKVDMGAFNVHINLNDPWDFSWGTYSSTTHEVTGDSLYLITTGTTVKTFWKLALIKQDYYGNLIFRFGSIDGNYDKYDTLFSAGTTNKVHKYYQFSSTAKPDREPDKNTWDITFNRYMDLSFNPQTQKEEMYPVVGVEANFNARVAKVYGMDTASIDLNSAYATYNPQATNDLTGIGYKWKFFDGTQFVVSDTMSYFIKAMRPTDTSYWLIHFTKFDGSTTGNAYFGKLRLSPQASIEVPELGSLNIFPNPAQNKVWISTETDKPWSGQIALMDINGKLIYTKNIEQNAGLNAIEISTDDLPSGVYLIRVAGKNTSYTHKIIIK